MPIEKTEARLAARWGCGFAPFAQARPRRGVRRAEEFTAPWTPD
ncbi:hypothetical protein [Streptomyces sp. NPDC092370]